MVRILRDFNKKGVGAPRGTAVGVSARVSVAGGQVSKDASPKSRIRRLIARNPAKGTNANIGTRQDVVNGFRPGVQGSLTTAMAGTNNDLVFTSKVVGVLGNTTRVRIVVAGNSTPLTVAVAGADITVNSATDGGGLVTSTANAVKAALDASAPAAALISTALAAGNDGTGLVAAFAYTALTGGADSILEGVDTVGDSSPTILKVNRASTPTHRNVVDRSPNRGVKKF